MHAKDSNLLLPKSDFVFGLLFGNPNNIDLLISLLQSILDLPPEEYKDIKIMNPTLKPEMPNDKTGILDVKITTKSKKVINVEMQVKNMPNLQERILFYVSMMFTKQIKKGQHYSKIKKVIGIYILDYNYRPGKNFHHTYNLIEKNSGDILTDLLEIHIIELKKVESDKSNMFCNWMKFLHADTEAEMAVLAKRSPKINKAYAHIVRLSADEKAQMIEEQLEKGRKDRATEIHWAREQGRKDSAKIIKAQKTALSKKDTALSEQAVALSEKDARIAQLEAALAGKKK
jgi:predicted transposase/invertase (TIGR01784 family)